MNRDFHAKFYDRVDKPVGIVERDLRRLVGLSKQYESEGLNTYESNEMHGLMDKYGIEAYYEIEQELS